MQPDAPLAIAHAARAKPKSMQFKLHKLEEDLEIENPPRALRKRLELIAQDLYGDDYAIKGPLKQVLDSIWNDVAGCCTLDAGKAKAKEKSMHSKLNALEEDFGITNPPKVLRKRLQLIARDVCGDDSISKGPLKQALESIWNDLY